MSLSARTIRPSPCDWEDCTLPSQVEVQFCGAIVAHLCRTHARTLSQEITRAVEEK